tara:strand:- start:531 stop:929 length:399 start_codon:yes stop_codon:yes gene_type:complete
MAKIIILLKFIFHISILLLITLSLYPGSLIGYLLYGDMGKQPNLIHNPFGTAINHFISYLYVSLLGLFVYLRNKNFKKLIFALFFLSAFLEILQLIVPNRSFQLVDLIGNILGVIVAVTIIKVYLFLKNNER